MSEKKLMKSFNSIKYVGVDLKILKFSDIVKVTIYANKGHILTKKGPFWKYKKERKSLFAEKLSNKNKIVTEKII